MKVKTNVKAGCSQDSNGGYQTSSPCHNHNQTMAVPGHANVCVLAAAGLEKGKKCPLALASQRRAA